ncbi:MAG: hypothetical protein COA81_02245 [Alphaproteobacteria bacterium]|nr:MAG: hypothetical protein COA81_02245 [Alphaproteobacteria bacterium]
MGLFNPLQMNFLLFQFSPRIRSIQNIFNCAFCGISYWRDCHQVGIARFSKCQVLWTRNDGYGPIQYQTRIARFPHHKDFTTFDYELSAVKQTEIQQLCTVQFTKYAHNLILVGGTDKTHITIELGTSLITQADRII